MKFVISFMVTLCFLKITDCTPLPAHLEKNKGTSSASNQHNHNKTIADIVQHQTDVIKQIVSHQQQEIRRDNPVSNKHASQEKETLSSKADEISLEELKLKCQHFAKLFNTTKHTERTASSYQARTTTQSPFASHVRPVYLKERNKGTTSTTQSTTKIPNGFFVTQSATQSPSTQSTTPSIPQNIKLIKLEPVILQKTVLNDGRIIYYWHKSLPSSVHYPQSSLSYNINQPGFENRETYQPTNYQSAYYYQGQYYNTIPSTASTTTGTTTTTTTSTTPPSSGGLSFRNYLPFYWSSDETASSTTEPPTQTNPTSTATQKTVVENNDDLLYANQLRFVVPLPMEDPDNITKYIWDFDKFAYYPKEIQPSTVKAEVPYVPTFQMIKALTIPNKYIQPNMDTSYDNYQTVNNYQYSKKK